MDLPDEIGAWERAVRDPMRGAPWPFTEQQFTAVKAALPAAINEDFVHAQILRAARTYSRSRSMRSRRVGKFNPRKEIQTFQSALDDLICAAWAVSPLAIEHLQATTRQPVVSLLAGLIGDAKGLRNLYGMEHLPPPIRQGRDTDRVLARLVIACDDIWSSLPAGRPRSGFPRFRDAICLPLGAGERDAKSWQDILRRAKELRVEAGRMKRNPPQ